MLRTIGAASAERASAATVSDIAEDALGGALRIGEAIDVAAVLEVGELQHAVHRSTDGRAVAAALPWRQVEVDRVLAQAGIALALDARPGPRPAGWH